MASKNQERLFLEQMLKDLGWTAGHVEERERPDFALQIEGRRIAVEVTKIFRREGRRGSPDAERERTHWQALRRVVEKYYELPGASPIKVDATFPDTMDCAGTLP